MIEGDEAMDYVLGIDLGSSSMKGLLMNEQGTIVAEKSRAYSMSSPKIGYSEQNPKDWILACEGILSDFSLEIEQFKEHLVGISFSGQMHSLVVLDENSQPVYPAILWNDVRTTKECKLITEMFGSEILQITKNNVLEGFTLPKILWLRENEPDVWQKVKRLMLPKDYLSYWFTGNCYTEYSDAAGTLLLDIENRTWSKPILDKFGISEDLLPKLGSSMAQVGVVRPEICERYQLEKSVKVFAGGADNACAALGAGLLSEDTALVSIGTSGVFSTIELDVKNYQGTLHFFNHVVPDAYYSMGVTLAAGNSLQWFKETFAKDKSFEELLSDINQVERGSEGLFFTPYIVGERTPHFDSQIRGSFTGIDTKHDLNHFTRSVLEGITFSLKDSQCIMEKERGLVFKQLISVGGGAKNQEWLQIQADIFNAEIIQLSVEQGPGLGACLIAAIGCGWFGNAKSAVAACVSYQEKTFYPKAENVEMYQKLYLNWKEIYHHTKNIM